MEEKINLIATLLIINRKIERVSEIYSSMVQDNRSGGVDERMYKVEQDWIKLLSERSTAEDRLEELIEA